MVRRVSLVDIMLYIKKGNDVAPDMFVVATEIYAKFARDRKERREVSKVLAALRTLGLARLGYVPEADYRGVPWLRAPAYRLTPLGLRFLDLYIRLRG